MVRIELEPLEQKDILEMLDYALEQKRLNRPINKGSNKWDDTKYWEIRISQLKALINGKNIRNGIYSSSLNTFDTPDKTKYDQYSKRWVD